MGPDEVLLRLAEQARAEYSAYLQIDGTVDLARLLQDGKGHLIKGIKETAHGRTIEFYDGQAALVHLGKHHGLFKDTGPSGTADDPVHVKYIKEIRPSGDAS